MRQGRLSQEHNTVHCDLTSRKVLGGHWRAQCFYSVGESWYYNNICIYMVMMLFRWSVTQTISPLIYGEVRPWFEVLTVAVTNVLGRAVIRLN